MRRSLLAIAALLLALAAPAPASGALALQGGAAGFDATLLKQSGAPQAGSHPYALRLHTGFSGGEVRNLSFEQPAGMIENPRAVPRCTQAQLASGCPAASQLGLLEVRTAGASHAFPLFNLDPAPGRPYQLGARPFGAPLVLTPTVRQGNGEYGITLTASNVTQIVAIEALDLELWGTPWEAGHDGQRGACLNEANPALPLAPPASCEIDPDALGQLTRAYLTMPADCSAPLRFSVAASGWEGGAPVSAAVVGQTPTACTTLPFSFGAVATPSTALASSPTGLTIRLTSSQAGLTAPAQRLSAQPRRAVATLAEGITINPSVGAGLGACSPAQLAAESATSLPGQGCPNPAKIGVGSVETPLVGEVLEGSLYIATPYQNPFGVPYALYFVAKAPGSGFVVKVPGRLDPDPLTGRLIASFENLPQLPYTNLKLEFREGQRAPLVSPPGCGTHANQIAIAPWSNPAFSRSEPTTFAILRGAGAGPCLSGGAPFTPKATAGSINAAAGANTSFYLHLTRTDAEQEITSYSAALPPGLLGRIAGVPFCADGSIEAAKGRSGFAEQANPSCPAQSEIGRTYSGYGAGLAPAYSAGKFYLAGPYKGAPLSVVAINPAVVGPFDLGTIVVRSAIEVDPRSARVRIDSSSSDPIPHIFAGIPLRLRDIRVHIDRPGFMVNPTSCAPFQVASTLTGSDVPFTNPKSATHTATVPFALSNCSSLEHSPALALNASGPTRRGGYPQLRVVVTPRAGDANIAAAAVTLPPSLFLAQNHIKEICTRAQLASEACPGRSVIGAARAETPLLSEPLQGSVYLRSSANPLPDLVTVLRGRGIRIVVECRIDSHRGGLRGTCEGLPDAPVSRFEMTIFGGKKRGVLISSEELCRSKAKGVARFVGQNNSVHTLAPKLAVKCKKPKKAKKGKGKKKAPGKRRGR